MSSLSWQQTLLILMRRMGPGSGPGSECDSRSGLYARPEEHFLVTFALLSAILPCLETATFFLQTLAPRRVLVLRLLVSPGSAAGRRGHAPAPQRRVSLVVGTVDAAAADVVLAGAQGPATAEEGFPTNGTEDARHPSDIDAPARCLSTERVSAAPARAGALRTGYGRQTWSVVRDLRSTGH